MYPQEVMMKGIFLLLGGNLENPKESIVKAIEQIKVFSQITAISKLYISEPWGNIDQPPFLNQAIEIETVLLPHQLLQRLLLIEQSLGRVRKERWGQRVIDIDILYFNNQIIDSQSLTIPHPRIHERRFALLPLNDIKADFIHPVFEKSQNHLLEICPDTSWVKLAID